MDEVAKGTIDIECGSTTASLSRQEQVDFSIMTFIDGGSLLVTDAGGVKDVASLGGKRVAVIPGTTTEKSLAEAHAEDGRHRHRSCRSRITMRAWPRWTAAPRMPTRPTGSS